MEARVVSREQVDAFRRDGFVVVPELLGEGELERFGREVDAAVARRRRRRPPRGGALARYEQSFVQCINLWEDAPGVRPLVFHPRIAESAARLLGIERLRLWHDQALYKEPGGRETDPHQDQPYWPIVETDTITAWIPFEDVGAESGCMGYVPGSHRFGVRKFVNIFTDPQPYDLLGGPESRGRSPVFVEAPRRSVAFHHGLTFHCAKPNRGARPRRVMTVIYFRDGSTRAVAPPHFAVDRAGIALGEAIASPLTPVAWPRSGTELPEPPARAGAPEPRRD